MFVKYITTDFSKIYVNDVKYYAKLTVNLQTHTSKGFSLYYISQQ